MLVPCVLYIHQVEQRKQKRTNKRRHERSLQRSRREEKIARVNHGERYRISNYPTTRFTDLC